MKFGGVIGTSGKCIGLIKHKEMPIQEYMLTLSFELYA